MVCSACQCGMVVCPYGGYYIHDCPEATALCRLFTWAQKKLDATDLAYQCRKWGIEF